MSENVMNQFPAQRIILIAGASLAAWLLITLVGDQTLLFLIGLAMGIALYHAAFGFSGAYHKLFTERDMTGVAAQMAMLVAAILLFAPILAQGSAFGHGVTGSIAPASLSMGFGEFLFGIGMQLGSGCASGVLYTAGGGIVRTMLVRVFFCAGAFWSSLDIGWSQTLPGIGSISLAQTFGWEIVLPLQIGALAIIFVGLRMAGWTMRPIDP